MTRLRSASSGGQAPVRSASSGGQGRGLWYGLGAYGVWGLFPIYWKLIEFVPASQIIAHRIVWSFLLLAGVPGGDERPTAATRAAPRVSARRGSLHVCCSSDCRELVRLRVGREPRLHLETSLGYFITPLVNVLLGVVDPARATANAAVGCRCACRSGRRLPGHRLRRRALDRDCAGGHVRDLRAGQEEGAAPAARRPDARDGPAVPAGARFLVVR